MSVKSRPWDRGLEKEEGIPLKEHLEKGKMSALKLTPGKNGQS